MAKESPAKLGQHLVAISPLGTGLWQTSLIKPRRLQNVEMYRASSLLLKHTLGSAFSSGICSRRDNENHRGGRPGVAQASPILIRHGTVLVRSLGYSPG